MIQADVAIVGAGVNEACVARTLSAYGLDFPSSLSVTDEAPTHEIEAQYRGRTMPEV